MAGVPGTAAVFAGDRRWGVDLGDATARMAEWPADSVHCCVTSPAYYGLRSYLSSGHPGKAMEHGAEDTPAEYVARVVDVFREVRRVLHPSGVCWLNLGDSYAAGGRAGGGGDSQSRNNEGRPSPLSNRWSPLGGCKQKDLLGIPWQVAFALRGDGWYLRQWCPWVKRNPMPESVEDRPGTACEVVFMLTKRDDYFFDMEAVKRGVADSSVGRLSQDVGSQEGSYRANGGAKTNGTMKAVGDASPRNFRNSDLWFESVGLLLSDEGDTLGFDVPVGRFKGAHFAVMPADLVVPCVKAGSSERGVCGDCGEPWVRRVERDRQPTRPGADSKVTGDGMTDGNRDPRRHVTKTNTIGWEPGCECHGRFESVPDGSPADWLDVEAVGAKMATSGRAQTRRAWELFSASSLGAAHLDAIWACGISDTGKALETTDGVGKNVPEKMRLAAEARAVLKGYYREFLLVGKPPKSAVRYVSDLPLDEHPVVPSVICDPFAGSGTTAAVAVDLGRRFVGCELNGRYLELIEKRVGRVTPPLFAGY